MKEALFLFFKAKWLNLVFDIIALKSINLNNMKCPNCGCEIPDPSFRFCPECRTKLPKAETAAQKPAESLGKTCPNCGTTNIDPSFRFCPNCRTKLTADGGSSSTGPEEKGFLNRLFKTYEKAVADPGAFKEWARKNPNDTAILLAKWSREGKDISMFSDINPSSDEHVAARNTSSSSQSTEKKKDNGKKEEAARQQAARAREGFSAATSGAADLIKGKAIWNVAPGEVARHITARQFEEISDNLDGILVEEGTSAIVYVDGNEVAQLTSGLYTFATEKVAKEVAEELIKEEKLENNGGLRNMLGRVARFFMGDKKGEAARKRDEKKARVRALTRRITGRSVVSVYLKSDGVFPALFGSQADSEGKLSFTPYLIPTEFLDVQVGINIQFRVADFKQFITNFMQGKESVSVSDIQKSIDPIIKSILRHQLRNVLVDEKGIPEQAIASLEENLRGIQDSLPGVEITRILDITTDNEDFERFRAVERRLYASEREYNYLIRTNEFQNRLESEKNRQLVAEARTEIELQAALDEVNKDKLLHDEEMEEFRQHYRNMQAISQATSDLELERALLGLKGDAMVSEDDFEAIEDGLKNKKFEREQISEVLRMRALANTSLAKISIDEELASAQIRSETNLRKAQIGAQVEIDDAEWEAHKAEMGRNAEEVDLEAAIYGRRIVLEKKQLSDAIELDRIQTEYQDERRIKEADVENELLDRKLAGQKKAEDQEFARRVREYEFEHGKAADEIELERMRKQVEYGFEKARKFDDAELLEREQKGALEMMKQMQEQELRTAQAGYTHEENILQTKATMTEEQLAAEQLKSLDREAQIEYMKSKGSDKEKEYLLKLQEEQKRASEAELARMNAAAKEQMAFAERMAQMVAGVAAGNQAAQAAERKAERESYERIATHRIGEVDSMKNEYRDQMIHEQGRVDKTTDTALNYTSRLSSAEASAKKEDEQLCPRCRGKLTNGFCPRCGWPDEE